MKPYIKYNFSFLEKLKKEYEVLPDTCTYKTDFTLRNYIKNNTYPHNCQFWSDFEKSFILDGYGNNFLGDTDNYVEQLNDAINKICSKNNAYIK